MSIYVEAEVMSNYNRTKNKPALKQIFDGYIEDTVSNEQIHRVLEPVLRLIGEGAFDRPRRLFGRGRRIGVRPVEFLLKKSK